MGGQQVFSRVLADSTGSMMQPLLARGVGQPLGVCIMTADFWGLSSAGGTATAYHLLAHVRRCGYRAHSHGTGLQAAPVCSTGWQRATSVGIRRQQQLGLALLLCDQNLVCSADPCSADPCAAGALATCLTMS